MERQDTNVSSKKGFDKTIIVGIVFFILLVILAVSTAYVLEGIIEFLRDVGTEYFSAGSRQYEIHFLGY